MTYRHRVWFLSHFLILPPKVNIIWNSYSGTKHMDLMQTAQLPKLLTWGNRRWIDCLKMWTQCVLLHPNLSFNGFIAHILQKNFHRQIWEDCLGQIKATIGRHCGTIQVWQPTFQNRKYAYSLFRVFRVLCSSFPPPCCSP